MSRSYPPLSDKDFQTAEQLLGFTLPEDLRQFYRLSNGGETDKPFYFDGETGFCVDYFLPLITSSKTRGGSVVETAQDYESISEPCILKKALTIAYDIGGNSLLYSLDKETFGKIYCTWPETTENWVRFICDKLQIFLSEAKKAPPSINSN